MKAAILANIGNTRSELCSWVGDSASQRCCWTTGELLAATWAAPAELGDGPILAACVVPAVRERLTRQLGARITWLDADAITSLDFSLVDSTTIGADRLANAVAAAETGPLPALVVDCGTAITLEAVDRQRRFRGGWILPGRRLQRQVLHSGTGQLPEIPLSEALPQPLGTTTADAIASGIDRGLLGAVERLMADCVEELGCKGPALATGGDAAWFCDHLDCLQAAPADFTLRGLATIADDLFD